MKEAENQGQPCRAHETQHIEFEEMVRMYRRGLTEYIFRKTRDYHAAEDLCQEAFFRAYKAMASLESPRRAKSWLYSIALHVTVDWLRKGTAGKRKSAAFVRCADFPEVAPATDSLLIQQEEEAEMKGRVTHLWSRVCELPPIYRQVFELRYRTWHPIALISRKIGIPEGNVKVRLFRARRMLMRVCESLMLNPISRRKSG